MAAPTHDTYQYISQLELRDDLTVGEQVELAKAKALLSIAVELSELKLRD